MADTKKELNVTKKELASEDDDKVTFSADKNKDFAGWYEQICRFAEIMDKRYPVKGMPVFRPYGYYIHNKIMSIIEDEWEKQGVERAQFPLVIPQDFLELEKEHVAGFESECFWVTKGGLKDLETKLALRPTSETVIYYMFSIWIRSFRDLPLKVHQTCAVYRHETKDTRPLIRVREIYWNEAHTCHSTHEEALENLENGWKSYLYLINDHLGFFGLRLRRPEWDKFAGAEHTDVLDTIMPCGRVLQTAGAHYLGQKFAKVFNIKFLNAKNEFEHGYMTCLGISTRLLAATIGIHGDNKGLIIPASVARYQVVIVPIVIKNKTGAIQKTIEFKELLTAAGIRVFLDDSNKSPGDKYYHWEMKGVPLRLEVGPRDVERNQFTLVLRDTGEKLQLDSSKLIEEVKNHLAQINVRLRAKAKQFHESHITNVTTKEALVDALKSVGGFARFPYHSMGHDGQEGDKIVHELTGGEIRGHIASEAPPETGAVCLVTGKPAKYWAYAARSY